MAFIPQELVDSIVAELTDMGSLKACSLVGPKFRDPAQRILLRSIALTGWPQITSPSGNYAATRTLLEQSPHVAEYIKDLKVSLHLNEDLEALQYILPTLVNVRRCVIDGYGQHLQWNLLPPGLATAFAIFFSRRSLYDLRLCRIVNMPPTVCLRSQPSLSFYIVGVAKSCADSSENISKKQRSPGPLRELTLHSGSQDVCALLASPDFDSRIAGLRRLSILPRYKDSVSLLAAARNSLEHLHFHCDVPDLPLPASLPILLTLRVLEFRIAFDVEKLDPLLTTISSLLNSTPTLAEVVLTLSVPLWNAKLLQTAARSGRMAALDDALMAHPAAPRIRWRAVFADPDQLDCFAELVRLGLPETNGKGGLVVEEYRRSSGEWPTSPTRIETRQIGCTSI
ncbi:hypothetical protein C8R47DRAFT_662195 [Mycena vitilis]|nr:hypothetical protein C8R47DRAFT_662195 [Mycena vitilis]